MGKVLRLKEWEVFNSTKHRFYPFRPNMFENGQIRTFSVYSNFNYNEKLREMELSFPKFNKYIGVKIFGFSYH